MPKKTKPVNTQPLLLRVSDNMIKGIDMAIELGQGNSRSEIIRMAIANYLKDVKIIDEIRKKKLK